jgi:hypothetical protein
MNRITPILFIVIASFTIQAQEEPFLKNEIRINAFNLLMFKSLDLSYERALNDESSVGINTMFSLDGNSRFNKDAPYYYEGFTLTPYYRLYFGKKNNAGFFAEGFIMLASGQYDYYHYETFESYDYQLHNFTDLAVGFSIGVKFLSKRNFVGNIHAGVGRYFIEDEYAPSVVGRFSVSFGWRF